VTKKCPFLAGALRNIESEATLKTIRSHSKPFCKLRKWSNRRKATMFYKASIFGRNVSMFAYKKYFSCFVNILMNTLSSRWILVSNCDQDWENSFFEPFFSTFFVQFIRGGQTRKMFYYPGCPLTFNACMLSHLATMLALYLTVIGWQKRFW